MSKIELGQRVEVRRRIWLVSDIRKSSLTQDQYLVTLNSIEDDAMGEELRVLWEVEPGASAGGPARDIIEGLAERFLVRVVACHAEDGKEVGDPRFVGPPHLVMLASDVMWSR